MKLTPTLGGSYSGSLGGMTASHNAGGPYLRRRAIPTNPNTLRQQTIRAAMGAAVQGWSMALTEPQRQAWRDYAANTPVTDRLGQTITLSGVNMFARSNVPWMQWNAALGNALTLLTSAPTIFNTGEPPTSVSSPWSGDFTTPPGTVTLQGTISGGASDDGDVLLFIAPPQTPGTRYYKGPYQLAATISIAETDTAFGLSSFDLANWLSSTVPVAGWDTLAIPLRLRILYDDGRLSETWEGLVPFSDATP